MSYAASKLIDRRIDRALKKASKRKRKITPRELMWRFKMKDHPDAPTNNP